MVMPKNPDAPATQRQLYRLHQLTGEDTTGWQLTMQQANEKISELDVDGIIEPPPPDSGKQPFNEAHVTLIEADQGGGKSCTAVGMVKDSYDNDCVRIFAESIGLYGVKVRGYDRKTRIARIKINGKKKRLRIPASYKLHSPMRIFANFHLYGLPYVFIPSFAHLLKWLKMGLIVDGWLIIDEYYVGGNARDSMTAFGKEMEKQSYQMRKMQLEVVIITPHARLIDKWTRMTPTKHIMCSFDKVRKEISLTIRAKGEKSAKTLPPFDATQYFRNYWTNERINK